MNLIIVESPTKSRTLAKFLDRSFSIRASVGHIRDLPKREKDAIDIKGGFIPHYEINEDKKKIIEELRTSVKRADDIYLATDPDREGEAIAWHIAQVLDLGNPKSKTLNPKQIQNPKRCPKHKRGNSGIASLSLAMTSFELLRFEFWYCLEFRY